MIALSIGGCNRVNTADDKINLTELLIGVSDMPPHWSLGGQGQPPEPERSSDSTGIGFYSDLYPEALGFSQEIYRHSSSADAKKDYQYALRLYGGGTIPPQWKFKSEGADESYFACEYYPNISFPVCQWLARYDRVVIQFGGWLIPGRMTLSDVENLVRRIDTKASNLFGK